MKAKINDEWLIVEDISYHDAMEFKDALMDDDSPPHTVYYADNCMGATEGFIVITTESEEWRENIIEMRWSYNTLTMRKHLWDYFRKYQYEFNEVVNLLVDHIEKSLNRKKYKEVKNNG